MAFLTLRFNSKTLNIATMVRIILPTGRPGPAGEDYQAYFDKKKEYPVLWLLHGGSDNYADWHQNTTVEVLAEKYGYAVVMPDAQASSYANMAHGLPWKDFYLGELREYIYSHFPISRKREDNFISGMSMGGFGALKFALLNPEWYSVCVPIASAVEVPRNYAKGTGRNPGKPGFFGDIFGHEDNPLEIIGSDEDCYHLLEKRLEEGAILPNFLFCVGLEDFTRDGNIAFKAFAEQHRVNIGWYEEHGMHDWDSWNTYIPKVFEFIQRCRG